MVWKSDLKNRITDIDQLEKHVCFPLNGFHRLRKINERHPMSIPRYYLSLIDRDDPDDPIRKMCVPSIGELNLAGSYDTSGEKENTKMPGLQHKYSQTALILATNRCAMYCRHCFRKRLVGLPTEEVMRRFRDAVNYIRDHEEINNVLISGGDPLILSTGILQKFLEHLSSIWHLEFIRIGSRIPVVLPSRIIQDDNLIDLFRNYTRKDKRLYVVTQFNHPREITEQSTEAVNRLLGAGVILNNQTVLLNGVNDDPDVLADLINSLVRIGVSPYYVFQCRPVKRVKSMFNVPLERGLQIVETAKKKMSGPAKRFKYVMSHRTGKIEIVGIMGDEIFFRYHQAKDPKNYGKFFKRKLKYGASWLDELY